MTELVLMEFGCSPLQSAMSPLYQLAFLTATSHSTTSSPSSARSPGKFNIFTSLCYHPWPFILCLLLCHLLTLEIHLRNPAACPRGLPFPQSSQKFGLPLTHQVSTFQEQAQSCVCQYKGPWRRRSQSVASLCLCRLLHCDL